MGPGRTCSNPSPKGEIWRRGPMARRSGDRLQDLQGAEVPPRWCPVSTTCGRTCTSPLGGRHVQGGGEPRPHRRERVRGRTRPICTPSRCGPSTAPSIPATFRMREVGREHEEPGTRLLDRPIHRLPGNGVNLRCWRTSGGSRLESPERLFCMAERPDPVVEVAHPGQTQPAPCSMQPPRSFGERTKRPVVSQRPPGSHDRFHRPTWSSCSVLGASSPASS